MKKHNLYKYVIRKNDIIIAEGTSYSCSEQLGMSQKSFYSLVSNIENGKRKNYSVEKYSDNSKYY